MSSTRIPFIFLFLAALVGGLSACGGGSGGDTPPPMGGVDSDGGTDDGGGDDGGTDVGVPSKGVALYAGEMEIEQTGGIYLADPDQPEVLIPRTPPPPARSRGVTMKGVNDTWLTYSDRQSGLIPYDLIAVRHTEPDVRITLNGPWPAGAGNSPSLGILPLGDTNRFLFVAEQETADKGELFLRDLDVPGGPVRISADLAPNGRRVAGPNGFGNNVKLTSDLSTVFYMAETESSSHNDLYRVRLSAPKIAARMNSSLGTAPFRGEVVTFRVAPNDQFLVYLARLDTFEPEELYLVNVDSPGVTTKVNATVIDDGDVQDAYQITHDSGGVVYMADAAVENQYNLYFTSASDLGVSVQLNPVFADDTRDVRSFCLSSDSQTVYFVADLDVAGLYEVYRVSTTAPGVVTKMSGTFDGAPGVWTIERPHLNTIETHLVFVSDRVGTGPRHAQVVDLSNPGTHVRISNDMPPDALGVRRTYWNEAGTQIFYTVDLENRGLAHLWVVDPINLSPGPKGTLLTPPASTRPRDSEVSLRRPLPGDFLVKQDGNAGFAEQVGRTVD